MSAIGISDRVRVSGSVSVTGLVVTGSTADGRVVPVGGIEPSTNVLRAATVDSTGSFKVVVVNPGSPSSLQGTYQTGSTAGAVGVLIGGTDSLGVIRSPFVDPVTRALLITGSLSQAVGTQTVTGSVAILSQVSVTATGSIPGDGICPGNKHSSCDFFGYPDGDRISWDH